MHDSTMAQKIAGILFNKKAKDIVAIDVMKSTVITDYMVIASGRSALQVKTLAEEVEQQMALQGLHVTRKEGHQEARWIVLDFNSVLVHIFHQEERAFYNLERLWDDGSNRLLLPFNQDEE